MSFTSEIKNEISLLNITKSEKIAELSGFIRAGSRISENLIEINTENIKIAKRMFSFIKDLYSIEPTIEQKQSALFEKKNIYYITIKDKVDIILEDLSVLDKNKEYLDVPNEYIVGSTDEIKAYIRGAFFSRGSVNDPKTSRYHLEFLFDRKHEAIFVQRLLNEFDLDSKILLRNKKIMIYIKDSEKISDFLKIIDAYKAVMYYENIMIFREQKNMTNRLNNCEQANIEKTITTCNDQINDINLILEKLGIDLVDDKLKEAISYRLKYPESSLTELSEIISLETNNTITKSGLNHRFRKIKALANKLRENEKE